LVDKDALGYTVSKKEWVSLGIWMKSTEGCKIFTSPNLERRLIFLCSKILDSPIHAQWNILQSN